MTREAVSTDQAPAALGPYSQAIVAGGFIFCSGMAGIDPATGTIPDGIEAQTEQALVNLAAVLAEAGATMDDIVKTTIFYDDVEDFGRLNEVYARTCPTRRRPARRLPTSGSRAGCSSRSRRSRYSGSQAARRARSASRWRFWARSVRPASASARRYPALGIGCPPSRPPRPHSAISSPSGPVSGAETHHSS